MSEDFRVLLALWSGAVLGIVIVIIIVGCWPSRWKP
jgi:hypothetical protein